MPWRKKVSEGRVRYGAVKNNAIGYTSNMLPRSDEDFSSFLGGRLFDVIMFDVDNKDSTVGMSCPPAAFVETSILQKVRSLLTPRGKIFVSVDLPQSFGMWHVYACISLDRCGFSSPCNLLSYLPLSAIQPGIFTLNLVCRDSVLRKSVLERVSAVFPTIISRKIEGEVNEVLLCSHGENGTSKAATILPSLNQAGKSLQSALYSNRTGPKSSPHIDIAELLKDLKIE